MQNGVIIKAKNSLNQGAAHFQPRPNPEGGFYGVVPMSELEKQQSKLFVTEETLFTVRHGMFVNFDNPWHRLCWEFLKHEPKIAKNEQEAKNNPYALFYISDEEQILKDSISVFKKKIKLGEWIGTLLPLEQRQVAELLGYKTAGNNTAQVENFLLTKASETDWHKLQQVKEWWKSGYAKKIQFLRQLLEKKILQYDSLQKWYTYGNPKTYIGKTQEEVISFLDHYHNQDLVRQFYAMLQVEEPVQLLSQLTEEDQIQVPLAPPAPQSDLLAQLSENLSQQLAKRGRSRKTEKDTPAQTADLAAGQLPQGLQEPVPQGYIPAGNAVSQEQLTKAGISPEDLA